jgi:hypothetical protein
MPDVNRRLDEALKAVKAPRAYQERALLGLRTLLADWEERAKRAWTLASGRPSSGGRS